MSGQWWESDLIVGPFSNITEANAWAAANPSSLFLGLLATSNGQQIKWGGAGWRDQGSPNPNLSLSIPGAQTANYVFPDQSPNGNDLRVESGNSAAYSTPGYIGTTAAVLGACRVSRDTFRINLSRDSFIVAFAMKRATAAADAAVFAIGTTAGEYIAITHKSTGYARIVCAASTGGAGALDASDAASPVDILISDAVPTEHHIVFAWSAQTRMGYKYVDGVLAYAYTTNSLVENGRFFTDADASGVLRLGGGGDYAASAAASLFRGFQFYKIPDGPLPLNLGEVANRLSRTPLESISTYDMQFAENICLSVIGQSNEVGAGSSGWVNRTGNSGSGMTDPIGPRGGYASMWPLLGSLAGRRGVAINVASTGYAATGIVDYWCGRCRTYSPGLIVGTGSYITFGGKTYKATLSFIGNYATLSADPVAGQAGITWTDLGASLPIDVDGAIYRVGDSNRFDPNNLLAYALDRATSTKRPGFGRYGVMISIGQSDARFLASSADYAKGITNAIEYCNSRGVKPFLGFTCYSADATIGPYMASTIYPGFLAAFADQVTAKGLAYAGADLWAGLGVLAAESTPNSDAKALLADNMHINPVAVTMAARFWDFALYSAGF